MSTADSALTPKKMNNFTGNKGKKLNVGILQPQGGPFTPHHGLPAQPGLSPGILTSYGHPFFWSSRASCPSETCLLLQPSMTHDAPSLGGSPEAEEGDRRGRHESLSILFIPPQSGLHPLPGARSQRYIQPAAATGHVSPLLGYRDPKINLSQPD